MSEPIYVHVSSLGTWLDDRRRWAVEHLGTKAPSDADNALPVSQVGAIIGNNAHAAAKVMLSQKRDGIGTEIEDIVELAVMSYRADCKKTKIEIDSLTKNQGDGELQMIKQVRAWHRSYFPQTRPELVEMKLERKCIGGVVLVGTPDLIERTSAFTLGVGDHKFGGHDGNVGSFDVQLGGYEYLVEGQEWFLPGMYFDDAHIAQTLRVGLKATQPDTKIIRRNPAACVELAQSVIIEIGETVERYRLTGDLSVFKPNPRSMFCNQKSCPAWGQADRCNQGGQSE